MYKRIMNINKIKKIAVPYDGSRCSKHAFQMALSLSQKYNSELILITCIEKLDGSWFGQDLSLYYQKDVKKHKAIVEKEISKLELTAKNSKIKFSSKLFVTDSTVNQILSSTKSNKVDMIVMGSHGRVGINRLLLGSVANGIAQRSKIPVLIVK